MAIRPAAPSRPPRSAAHRAPALAIALAGLAAASCTPFLFHPSRAFRPGAEVVARAPADVWFDAADGVRLHGWLFRAAAPARGTVVVLHGNAANVATLAATDLWLVDDGWDVFAFDYRGYGRSTGEPDWTGVHLDAAAALETALFDPRLGARGEAFVFGKSMGGAIAVETVARSPHRARVRGLVVQAAFASFRREARETMARAMPAWERPLARPISWLLSDAYSPLAAVPRVAPVPLLVLHSRGDGAVPFEHGRALFEAAGEPKAFWEIPEAVHVGRVTDERTRQAMRDFLSRF
jgi:fermentation-respiration switch protein FrsA (DUF1100 family)